MSQISIDGDLAVAPPLDVPGVVGCTGCVSMRRVSGEASDDTTTGVAGLNGARLSPRPRSGPDTGAVGCTYGSDRSNARTSFKSYLRKNGSQWNKLDTIKRFWF